MNWVDRKTWNLNLSNGVGCNVWIAVKLQGWGPGGNTSGNRSKSNAHSYNYHGFWVSLYFQVSPVGLSVTFWCCHRASIGMQCWGKCFSLALVSGCTTLHNSQLCTSTILDATYYVPLVFVAGKAVPWLDYKQEFTKECLWGCKVARLVKVSAPWIALRNYLFQQGTIYWGLHNCPRQALLGLHYQHHLDLLVTLTHVFYEGKCHVNGDCSFLPL